MAGVQVKHCENCGVPHQSEKARFCSQECRTARDKGGKTAIEKDKERYERINKNWLKRPEPKRKPYIASEYY